MFAVINRRNTVPIHSFFWVAAGTENSQSHQQSLQF